MTAPGRRSAMRASRRPTLAFARGLVAAYPTPANWRDALAAYRDVAGDPVLELDIRRLMRAAGVLAGERDYMEFAGALADVRLIGEARAVIDEGAAGQYGRDRAHRAGAGDADRAGRRHPRSRRLARSAGPAPRPAPVPRRERPPTISTPSANMPTPRRSTASRCRRAARIPISSTCASAPRSPWRAAGPRPRRRCGSSPGRAPILPVSG